MKIAFASYDILWESPEKNRSYLDTKLIKGDDLYILPEMFNSGFSMHPEKFAEDMEGPSISWMRSKARDLEAAICGSLAIRTSRGFANRFVFVQPNGDLEYYDKRHLFAYSGEDKHFTPGNDRVVISYKDWRILLQVCYDLRFPVFARNRMDYELAIYVANWPSTRAAHWRALLKARAIENQSYVIGVNRIGKDGNGLSYSGDSQVYDSNGACIAESKDAEGIFKAELDLEGLQNYRKDLPFLDDADTFVLKS